VGVRGEEAPRFCVGELLKKRGSGEEGRGETERNEWERWWCRDFEMKSVVKTRIRFR
jgi:hypothetical protein